jgi:hypothetical protein
MKLFLVLLFLAFPVQAEIYKWVDENGKTHFGDRVPEKYQEKADNVELKMHQPTEEDIAEAENRNAALTNSRKLMETSNRSTRTSSSAPRKKTRQYASDYDRQMSEYRQSKSCFSACQVTRPKSPHIGGTYLDNSACGHCTNAKKPQR